MEAPHSTDGLNLGVKATELLGETSLGLGSNSPADRRRFAKRWLDETIAELRPLACGRPNNGEVLYDENH